MSVPENASLYPFFTLSKGQTVRFTALDPTDNSTVTGVQISKMVLGVNQEDTVLAPAAQLSVSLIAGG